MNGDEAASANCKRKCSLTAFSSQCHTINLDIGKGTSADVPRFGLEMHSVSSALIDEQKFWKKFDEFEDFLLFSDKFLAN